MRSLFVDADGNQVQHLDRRDIELALRSEGGLLWVDLNDNGAASRELLGEVFHFHQLAIDDCFNGRIDTPKVDDYGDYLFVVSQSISYRHPARQLAIGEVDMFVGANYVVTVHVAPVPELDELFDRALTNDRLMTRGADILAHMVLDCLVDRILPVVEAIDSDLAEMEERVLSRPDREILPAVLHMRRLTMRLRRSILPQRDVVNRLSRGEFPRLIRRESLIFYRDVYDHTVRVEGVLEGIRDVADSVLSTYLSSVNNRMNEVMKTLSVVTAIFLPLTLIASIFGTNLDYSSLGLKLDHGFAWMLGSMVLVASAMVLYFNKRGWF